MRASLLVFALVLTSGFVRAQEAPSEPARLARVEASVGLHLVSRHLRFHDDLYGFQSAYDLPAGPALGLRARVYPFGFGSLRIGEILGLEARYERSFGVESQQSGGVRFPTTHQVIEANLLGRGRIRDHELAVILGYGNHAFVQTNETPWSPSASSVRQTPNVRYSYLRLGGEARLVAHPRLRLVAGAGFLVVLDAGGIQSDDWFPRSRASGVTLALRLAVPLARGFELSAGLDYRRYFFDLRPQVGDARVVGGALDQFAVVELAGVYRY